MRDTPIAPSPISCLQKSSRAARKRSVLSSALHNKTKPSSKSIFRPRRCLIYTCQGLLTSGSSKEALKRTDCKQGSRKHAALQTAQPVTHPSPPTDVHNLLVTVKCIWHGHDKPTDTRQQPTPSYQPSPRDNCSDFKTRDADL